MSSGLWRKKNNIEGKEVIDSPHCPGEIYRKPESCLLWQFVRGPCPVYSGPEKKINSYYIHCTQTGSLKIKLLSHETGSNNTLAEMKRCMHAHCNVNQCGQMKDKRSNIPHISTHSLEARLVILVLLYLPVHNYKCTGTSTQSLFLSAERITFALTSLMIYILTWLWSWQPYNSRVQPILTDIMIICLLLIKRSLHWGPGMLQVNSLEATGQQHLYVAILN